MKRNLITSAVFLGYGLALGVFYREFTKFNAFNGRTALAFAHPHVLVLGCLLFLILSLTLKDDDILKSKKYQWFYYLQIVGLTGTSLMMVVRGILQVLNTSLSNGVNSLISGLAGVFHIVLATALVLLFIVLFDYVKKLTLKKEVK